MRYVFFGVLFFFLPIGCFSQNQLVSGAEAFFNGEPFLAINPSNHNHLVVAWIGVDIAQGGVIKTSYSMNSGVTWSTPTFFPHQVSGNSSADPSLAFDHLGNVFACYIDYDSQNISNGGIYVRKSTDNGATWGAAIEAIDAFEFPDQLAIDRPWMSIQTGPGINQGAIYVTSMNPDRPEVVAPYHPYYAVSTDGGLTFSATQMLDGPGYWSGSLITQPMPSHGIQSNGTWLALYPSYETSQSFFAQGYIARSTDAGNTLSYEPTMDFTGANLTDPYMKKASQFVVSPYDSTSLAMIILRNQIGDPDVYVSRSQDNGLNWSALQRVNQDPAANGVMQDLVWGSFNEAGDLAICWRDRRNASGTGYSTDTEIYGAVLSADSANVTYDFVLSSQLVAHQAILLEKGNDFQSVSFLGDTIYNVWGDVRTGILRIYLNKYSVSTGVNATLEIPAGSALAVYPNPATDQLRIEGLHQETIQITNENGQLVYNGPTGTIDLREWKRGSYYIKSASGLTHAFVKQ